MRKYMSKIKNVSRIILVVVFIASTTVISHPTVSAVVGLIENELPERSYAGGNTYYLDYENGNDANDGSSWALAWKTITSGATAARIAPGDVIRIAKSPDPVSVGNATWTNLSKTVTLASAQTDNIDLCEIAWTPAVGGDVVVALTGVATDGKEGASCMKFTTDAATQPSILQAYYDIATLNLSSYQKISFWIKNQSAIADATTWEIALCSDNAGAVVVDTFAIPAIPSTLRWLPLTIARTGGGNLGNAIESIAIYSGVTNPAASKYIYVDDFVACTTNGLNLQSLISKNSLAQGGTEGWYGVQSIDDVTVLLDNDTNTKGNTGRGYATTGTSPETVTTYKRETIKTSLAASSGVDVQAIQDSGSIGSTIDFVGGYNTVTSVRDGETFFDGLNGYGRGIRTDNKDYITVSGIDLVRYYDGIYLSSAFSELDIQTIANCGEYGITIYNRGRNVINIQNVNNNKDQAVRFNGAGGINNTVTLGNVDNNLATYAIGLYVRNRIMSASLKNNNGVGIYVSCGTVLSDIVAQDNATSSLYVTDGVKVILINASLGDATYVTTDAVGTYWDSTTYAQKFDGDTSDNRIFSDGAQVANDGLMFSQTGTRHTASGLAWEFQPGSIRTSVYPASLSIAKIAVTSGNLVTFTAWMKKDHATDIACRIRLPAYSIAGVVADVTDTKADDVNWEQLTITFTPAEAGVVEIFADAWYVSGNSNAYVHDVEWSQD